METIAELQKEAHDAKEEFEHFFCIAIILLPVVLIPAIASIFGLIIGDFGFIGGDAALKRTFLIGMSFSALFAYFFDGALYFWVKNQAKLEEIQELKSQA